MADLLEIKNQYPSALTPQANNIQDVIDTWKDAGLEPVEVSEDDLITEISIKAAKHTGKMEWSVKKADGVRAMSIMAIAIKSMFQEYLKDGGRPKLATNSPDSKILIQLENNTIKMAYDQTQDPMVIKGLLMSCLWKMIDQINDGHPLDIFAGLLKFKAEGN